MLGRQSSYLLPAWRSSSANIGSPIFCGLWTLCGVPALNLPVGKDVSGLPLGCQLVGRFQADFQLLTVARWCWAVLSEVFGEIQVPLN